MRGTPPSSSDAGPGHAGRDDAACEGAVRATPIFNADFWEVTVSQESWRAFTTADHLYYEEPVDEEAMQARQERLGALWPQVRALMDEILTPRQRDVVTCFYFRGLNQRRIAEALGISQQSVSEHLYGKNRNGRAVGGALGKLRKACAERGIEWE